MPGQGRKRSEEQVTPVVEGELVPSKLEELDEPEGREGSDELADDAVEMADADDEADEDEDEDADDEDADDEDEDDEDDEDEDEDEDAEDVADDR